MLEIFNLNKINNTTLSNWSKIEKNEHGQWIWSLEKSSEIIFHTSKACKMLFIISAYTPAKNQKAQILIDNTYLANVDGNTMNNMHIIRNVTEGKHIFKVTSNKWNTRNSTTPDWSWSSDPISVFFNKITIQCNAQSRVDYSPSVVFLCSVSTIFFIYWLVYLQKKY